MGGFSSDIGREVQCYPYGEIKLLFVYSYSYLWSKGMSNLGYEWFKQEFILEIEDGSDITELAAVRNWACNLYFRAFPNRLHTVISC